MSNLYDPIPGAAGDLQRPYWLKFLVSQGLRLQRRSPPAVRAGEIHTFNDGGRLAIADNRGIAYPITTGLHSLWYPAGGIDPAATSGCTRVEPTSTSSGYPDTPFSLLFENATAQYGQFLLRLPPGMWDYTKPLFFEPVWMGLAGGSGDMTWRMRAIAIPDSNSFTPFDVVAKSTQAFIDSANLMIGPRSDALLPSGALGAGCTLICEIYRNAADPDGLDTFSGGSNLLGVTIFFSVIGSSEVAG